MRSSNSLLNLTIMFSSGAPTSNQVVKSRKFSELVSSFPRECKDVSSLTEKKLSSKYSRQVAAGWGVIGVISILANAIKRLLPIAIEPFIKRDLTPLQLAICCAWTSYMVYVEGYKAFQLKFSPLAVSRAFTLTENPSMIKYLLAGPYCMGLFAATKKRMITSWSITGSVFVIAVLVKKLPYPWRSIVDMGVVGGLSYGTLSIVWQFMRALFGTMPDVDPCLPVPAQFHELAGKVK